MYYSTCSIIILCTLHVILYSHIYRCVICVFSKIIIQNYNPFYSQKLKYDK